jgi:iron(III) transport system substrate-binding protein
VRARIVAALAAALVALTASACGDGDGSGDALTVYSGRSEELVAPILERFSEESGVRLDVRYGDTADLALLLAEEGGRSPADVFFSQSPGATAYLAERDLLAPLPAALTRRVEPRFASPQRLWVGVTGRQRVLVYNRELVDRADLPRSVFELTQPRYRGRVGVAPTNGSFQDFVTAIRQARGDAAAAAFLGGLADNGARAYENNVAIVEAVGRGEIPMGLVNHYYNYRAQAEDPDVASVNHQFAAGDLGGLVLVASVSELASTDQAEEARALVRFLLSEEAQTYFTTETFEYPLTRGVAASPELPPLARIETAETDFGRLADLERTAELIAESGLG